MKPTPEMIEAATEAFWITSSERCIEAALTAALALVETGEPGRRVKLPPIGEELYEHYAMMSAQTHEAAVKEYARNAHQEKKEAMSDFIAKVNDQEGVCLGGRWQGWLFRKHPDGQWVSVRKLEQVDAEEGNPFLAQLKQGYKP